MCFAPPSVWRRQVFQRIGRKVTEVIRPVRLSVREDEAHESNAGEDAMRAEKPARESTSMYNTCIIHVHAGMLQF